LQGLVHFGPACLSQQEKLPVLYIFEKVNIEVNPFLTAIATVLPEEENYIIASDLKYNQSTGMFVFLFFLLLYQILKVTKFKIIKIYCRKNSD
jgi:diphthamide biosynthesis enzyme Dph1/Dph2-like protein